MGNQVKLYCEFCHLETWHWVPNYVCERCGKSSPPSSKGEGAVLGCGCMGAGLAIALIFSTMMAVNSLLLLPALISQPWGLAASVILVVWLWNRDNLRKESFWVRYGVSVFLIVWMGLLFISVVTELLEGHILSTGKELLFITLPGTLCGFLATRMVPRWEGTLWPVFVAICLAHTIGKLTILGWIMNRF